jgi:hypothetical protein
VFGIAFAAIEELTRLLAASKGPHGVLGGVPAPGPLPETWSPDAPADLAAYMTARTMLTRRWRRSPTPRSRRWFGPGAITARS